MNVLTVPATPKVYSFALKNPPGVIAAPPEDDMDTEERVTLLLMRDLVRLGWRLKSNTHNSFKFVPPATYTKDVVKAAMAYARNEILTRNEEWIDKHIHLARANLASGEAVLASPIRPRIEVCNTEKSHSLFRLFRYYWSSPYSEYVGRRLRLIIRDDGIEGSPVIGIAALGSSIIHIPDRDKWIGWNTQVRTQRIAYMMDAYVIGALPPYNYLLGGKLIAYLLASNEVRAIYRERYENHRTLINEREVTDLVLIVTSSLYGENSSQYNRLKFYDKLLYQPIGSTAGYGTLHISQETFHIMKSLTESRGCTVSHRFGDGPNWRMRVIRTACDLMDLDAEVILKHSFQRGLYAVPLATNWKAFLLGKAKKPKYMDLPMEDLAAYWRSRWLEMRQQNPQILATVKNFTRETFCIEQTPLRFFL